MDVKLVMFKRDGQRKDFKIRGDTTVIGRAEDCSLRIPLLAVSRKHCELIRSEQDVRVRDLASSNGTYVNNRRVNETALKAGDRLVVGPIVFTVQIDGVPEQINPVKTKLPAAAQAAAGEDEIVDLEADVDVTEETDPIAALEALADHSKKKKK